MNIEIATGQELDNLAKLFDLERFSVECDQSLRHRIISEYGLAFHGIKPKVVVCECGKDKHNFANHSNWCPLFT